MHTRTHACMSNEIPSHGCHGDGDKTVKFGTLSDFLCGGFCVMKCQKQTFNRDHLFRLHPFLYLGHNEHAWEMFSITTYVWNFRTNSAFYVLDLGKILLFCSPPSFMHYSATNAVCLYCTISKKLKQKWQQMIDMWLKSKSVNASIILI